MACLTYVLGKKKFPSCQLIGLLNINWVFLGILQTPPPEVNYLNRHRRHERCLPPSLQASSFPFLYTSLPLFLLFLLPIRTCLPHSFPPSLTCFLFCCVSPFLSHTLSLSILPSQLYLVISIFLFLCLSLYVSLPSLPLRFKEEGREAGERHGDSEEATDR